MTVRGPLFVTFGAALDDARRLVQDSDEWQVRTGQPDPGSLQTLRSSMRAALQALGELGEHLALTEGETPGPHEITSDEWQALRPTGEAVPVTVTAASTCTDIEDSDGFISVSVYPQEDGLDIRIHDLQLVVKKQHIVLLRQHPPYPITRWTIFWEGDL